MASLDFSKFDVVTAIFAIVLLIICYIVYRWNKDSENPFELKDLVMENGKASKLAFTWLGSFLIMTYGFVHMIIHNTLTDSYAALYSATWAAGIGLKMFAPRKEDPKP